MRHRPARHATVSGIHQRQVDTPTVERLENPRTLRVATRRLQVEVNPPPPRPPEPLRQIHHILRPPGRSPVDHHVPGIRIDRGLALGLEPGKDIDATPACVAVCPVKARTFGDINDPESEVSQILATSPHFRLREDMGTNPRVYYLPARRDET